MPPYLPSPAGTWLTVGMEADGPVRDPHQLHLTLILSSQSRRPDWRHELDGAAGEGLPRGRGEQSYAQRNDWHLPADDLNDDVP